MGKARVDVAHEVQSLGSEFIPRSYPAGRGEREKHESMIVEAARFIDRLSLQVETKRISPVRLTRETLQEVDADGDCIRGPGLSRQRGFRKYICLPRYYTQAPKIGSACKRLGVEMLVKGPCFPIYSIFQPQRPRRVSKPRLRAG